MTEEKPLRKKKGVYSRDKLKPKPKMVASPEMDAEMYCTKYLCRQTRRACLSRQAWDASCGVCPESRIEPTPLRCVACGGVCGPNRRCLSCGSGDAVVAPREWESQADVSRRRGVEKSAKLRRKKSWNMTG